MGKEKARHKQRLNVFDFINDRSNESIHVEEDYVACNHCGETMNAESSVRCFNCNQILSRQQGYVAPIRQDVFVARIDGRISETDREEIARQIEEVNKGNLSGVVVPDNVSIERIDSASVESAERIRQRAARNQSRRNSTEENAYPSEETIQRRTQRSKYIGEDNNELNGKTFKLKCNKFTLMELPIQLYLSQYKTWVATVQIDPDSYGGLKRNFHERAKAQGGFSFVCKTKKMKINDVLEMASDRFEGIGRIKNRCFAVVVEVAINVLTVVVFKTPQDAFAYLDNNKENKKGFGFKGRKVERKK